MWILLWHNFCWSYFDRSSSAFSFARAAVFALMRLRPWVTTLERSLSRLDPVVLWDISIFINIIDHLLVVLFELLDIVTDSCVQSLFNTWSHTVHVFHQGKILHAHFIALGLNASAKVVPARRLLGVDWHVVGIKWFVLAEALFGKCILLFNQHMPLLLLLGKWILGNRLFSTIYLVGGEASEGDWLRDLVIWFLVLGGSGHLLFGDGGASLAGEL